MNNRLNNGETPHDSIEEDDFQVDSFILSALSNPRDRLSILKLDQELETFLHSDKQQMDYPPMSSYQRLIVHRVAEYFKLDHTVVELEPGRKSIVLAKTKHSKIPILRFADLIESSKDSESSSKKNFKIMRRQNSQKDSASRSNHVQVTANSSNNKDRTLEEREEEYARARARIFGSEDVSSTINEPSSNQQLLHGNASDTESKMSPELRRNDMAPNSQTTESWNPDTAFPSVDLSYYYMNLPESSFHGGYLPNVYPTIWSGYPFYNYQPQVSSNSTHAISVNPSPLVQDENPHLSTCQNSISNGLSYDNWSFYSTSVHQFGHFPPYIPEEDMYHRRPPPKSTQLFDPNAPASKSSISRSAIHPHQTNNLLPRVPSSENVRISGNRNELRKQEKSVDQQMHSVTSEMSNLENLQQTPKQLPHILQIGPISEKVHSEEFQNFLQEVKNSGARLKWIDKKSLTLLAIFGAASQAQKAMLEINRNNVFKLRSLEVSLVSKEEN